MNQPSHILLIEDDAGVGRSLEDALQREAYQVGWRTTGAEGVTYAQDEHPDLIILDVGLPDGSGFDLCRRLPQL